MQRNSIVYEHHKKPDLLGAQYCGFGVVMNRNTDNLSRNSRDITEKKMLKATQITIQNNKANN